MISNWYFNGIDRTVLSLSIVVISTFALYSPASENNGPVISIVPEGSGIMALDKSSKVPSTFIVGELVFLDAIVRLSCM